MKPLSPQLKLMAVLAVLNVLTGCSAFQGRYASPRLSLSLPQSQYRIPALHSTPHSPAISTVGRAFVGRHSAAVASTSVPDCPLCAASQTRPTASIQPVAATQPATAAPLVTIAQAAPATIPVTAPVAAAPSVAAAPQQSSAVATVQPVAVQTVAHQAVVAAQPTAQEPSASGQRLQPVVQTAVYEAPVDQAPNAASKNITLTAAQSTPSLKCVPVEHPAPVVVQETITVAQPTVPSKCSCGCEPGAAATISPELFAGLVQRVENMETELGQSRRSVTLLQRTLAQANEQTQSLKENLGQWQDQVRKLEKTMQDQHEADIVSLNRISQILGTLMDEDAEPETTNATVPIARGDEK
ncbi:MAG: hypothetical protein R3C49_09775 [Planctomycetaceae bacterium]